MARDRITAIILQDRVLEWTTLSTKGGGKVEESNRLVLTPPVSPEGAGSADGVEAAPNRSEQLKAACAPFKGHALVGALATEQLLLRVVELPIADADEREGMVSLQVDKFSPFPVDTMVVGHEILRQDAESCLVLIAAVKRDALDAYENLLLEAGLPHPDRVDACIMGWWRILSNTEIISSAGRQVFVFLENAALEMIVTQDGIPFLFRSISGLQELPPDQAVAEVAHEVAHSLLSLELEHGGGASNRLYLWGREEISPDLVTALKTECDCTVEIDSLDRLPPLSEGLARRGVGSKERDCVDLTPPAWRETEASADFQKKLVLYSSVALLVWVLSLAVLLGGLSYERHRLSTLQERFAALHERANEVEAMRKRVFRVERYVDVESSALESLRAISLVQPDGMDLSSFSYRKGEGVRIKGEADGVNMVYTFKNQLDESGVFVESELFGPRRDSRRRKDVFEIVLQLPGEAE